MTKKDVENLIESKALENKIKVVSEQSTSRIINNYVKVTGWSCTLLLALLCFMGANMLNKLDALSEDVSILKHARKPMEFSNQSKPTITPTDDFKIRIALTP